MPKPNLNQSQNGNAIMIILVAVALFAALSFVFSNTSRNSSGFVTDAEADAYANQIIAYGNEVKQAVKRLRLRGCSDTEISFENSIISGYTNPNSPTDRSCHVFDTAGGGLNFTSPPRNSFDESEVNAGFYAFSGLMNINLVGETNDNATSSELYVISNFIDKEVCQKINARLGTEVGGKDNPEITVSGWSTKFIGTFGYSGTRNEADIAGKKEICVRTTSTANLHQYLKVLIER